MLGEVRELSEARQGLQVYPTHTPSFLISMVALVRLDRKEEARAVAQQFLSVFPTYRIVPKPELETADKAKVWYEKAGVEGVVAVRPVSSDKVRSYTSATWVGSSYSSFWSYYPYAWSGVYIPGSTREDTYVVVEALVFSVPLNKLLWAGASETKNPKQLQQFVKDLVVAATKEMQQEGLITKSQ